MAKITIFGLAGTGTSSTGKALAKELNIPFVSSGNIFRKKAAELNMSLIEFVAMTEKDSSYDKILDNELTEYGKNTPHYVIESRLAWFFNTDSIKIKLTCDRDERLRRVAQRDGITLEQAISDTDFREEKALERYKNLYGIELYTDDAHFDHIIDTTNTGVDEIVSKIKSFVV
ncbi:MAG: hypothetical protein RL094_676 [Candidatus Parcubacteria bacterium]|jgi:cytidylate kinase